MGWWRPVDCRIWGRKSFWDLPSDNARLLWLNLLTHPKHEVPGLIPLGPMAVAEGLRWKEKKAMDRLGDLIEAGMIFLDPASLVLYLPRALDFQPPDNPNIIRGWAKPVDAIPESPLKDLWILQLHENHIERDNFLEAIVECFGNPPRNPSLNGILHRPGDGIGNNKNKNKPKPKPKNKPGADPQVIEIVSLLNAEAGRSFDLDPVSDPYARAILARIEDYSLEDAKAVVITMSKAWKNDGKMMDYLTPDTLFRPSNFPKYLERSRTEGRRGEWTPKD